MVRPELLNSIASVGRFAYHNHIGLNANQTGYPLAHDWMVVNGQNSNLRAAGVHELLLDVLALRENHELLCAVA
jgi:hypothetical protein